MSVRVWLMRQADEPPREVVWYATVKDLDQALNEVTACGVVEAGTPLLVWLKPPHPKANPSYMLAHIGKA